MHVIVISVRALGGGCRGHTVIVRVSSSERAGLRDHVHRTGISQIDSKDFYRDDKGTWALFVIGRL